MKFHLALLGLLATITSADEMVITVPTDADHLAQVLLANQDSVEYIPGTAVLTGDPNCARIFSGGQFAVPDGVGTYGTINFPDTGFILSTGSAAALPFQNSTKTSTSFKQLGDADLQADAGIGRNGDACALTLNFMCTSTNCGVAFDYVWGSEEYNESVNRNFNDAFGFYLNGMNIALLENGDRVSVDTVNNLVNSEFYIDNDPANFNNDPSQVPFPGIEADGFTRPLRAVGAADTTGVNELKLVLADFSDLGIDSWVVFREDSLITTEVTPTTTLFIPPTITPPGGTTGGGDPHFTRWGQGHRDTFHGECDIVVMHSDLFHNDAGLDFHVRTTIRHDLYSYIEAAAVRLGEDVLEINNGKILLNGAIYEDEDLPIEFGQLNYKFEITKMQKDEEGEVVRRHYLLHLNDDYAIEFKYYKHLLTYAMPGYEQFVDSTGLVGSFPLGNMIGRDGRTMEDFVEYGFEWQVSLEDPVLFNEKRSPQLPFERCRMPSRSTTASRRRLRSQNSKLYEDAQIACAAITGSNFDLCVDDVVMTGDIGLAEEW